MFANAIRPKSNKSPTKQHIPRCKSFLSHLLLNSINFIIYFRFQTDIFQDSHKYTLNRYMPDCKPYQISSQESCVIWMRLADNYSVTVSSQNQFPSKQLKMEPLFHIIHTSCKRQIQNQNRCKNSSLLLKAKTNRM